MLPQSQQRKKKNSSKVNLTISVVVHAILLGALFYFAARQGFLGEKVKKLTVTFDKKPKPPEKPKEPEKKIEPPKTEPLKVEPPKFVEAPKPSAPAPAAPPTAAPPVAEVPAFEFEGGKTVETSTDPVQLYKGYMEYVLRQKWNRPDNMVDDSYVAEVAVNVD